MRPINAYAYDFWQHESVRPLIEANGLRPGDVWFELQNFSMILTTLLTNLRILLIDRVAQPKEVDVMENRSEDTDNESDMFEAEDKAEDEAEDEEDMLEEPNIANRPPEVPEEDWIVYEAFASVTTRFYGKWRKMWA